jgi:hypothetical protein
VATRAQRGAVGRALDRECHWRWIGRGPELPWEGHHPAETYRDGRGDRDPTIRNYFQKAGRVFSEESGNEREFGDACAFANPSPGTLRRHALGVVRGDEPDCPGKRNLLNRV